MLLQSWHGDISCSFFGWEVDVVLLVDIVDCWIVELLVWSFLRYYFQLFYSTQLLTWVIDFVDIDKLSLSELDIDSLSMSLVDVDRMSKSFLVADRWQLSVVSLDRRVMSSRFVCLAEVYIRPSSWLDSCSITLILHNYSSTYLLNKSLLIPSSSPSDGPLNKSSSVVSSSISLFTLQPLQLLPPKCHKSRVAIRIGWATSLNLLVDPTSQSVQTIHTFKSVWIISKIIWFQLASKTFTPITNSVNGIWFVKSY